MGQEVRASALKLRPQKMPAFSPEACSYAQKPNLQGLEPRSVCAVYVWAEARTYLKNEFLKRFSGYRMLLFLDSLRLILSGWTLEASLLRMKKSGGEKQYVQFWSTFLK
jgi:hypothetical protein